MWGCQTSPRGGSAASVSQAVAVRLDGSVEEWPADAACVADADYVYVRFTVKDEEFTLQHAPSTLAVYLDLDSNAETGVQAEAPSPDARGADMVIEFSPRSGGAEPGQGVAVYAVGPDGTRRVVRHADVDLSFAPTYAAPWYEVRVSRHPAATCALAGPMAGSVAVRGMVAYFDEGGSASRYSDGFVAALPVASPGGPVDVDVPARGAGDLRIVSWNVQKSSPVEHPDAFARVLKCLDPDVVLLQEWDKGDARAIEAWFTAFVPSGSGWQVVKSEDGDVAIASRYPLSKAGAVARATGDDRPVRFVAAVTTTPHGDVLAATTHLKCCGSKGSAEDTRRLVEARAIDEAVRGAQGLPSVRVLGGDLNLVGTRLPLDAIGAELDSDGSDLEIADPVVLGDTALYTWSDDASEFTPGRLDFVLWSGASAGVTRQFVLDTSRLSAKALLRAGLREADTRASDHLPVVVDLAMPATAVVGDQGAGESGK